MAKDHPTQRRDGFGQFYIIWAKGIMRYKNWIHESKVWNCGQNEPTPTNAPMWMDGTLMGVPFSSLPIHGLSKVVNLSWLFFRSLTHYGFLFFWEPFSSPPPLLRSHLPTYPPTHAFTYLCTYTFSFHQSHDNERIAIY